MYADLPLGINLIEDPSFERGVALWSDTHPWLLGSNSIQWRVFSWSPPHAPGIISLQGSHIMYLNGAASATDGSGGAWYDLGVLPEGDYITSASFFTDTTSPNTMHIKFRAGRSNDVAAPPLIGSAGLLADTWETISGIFHSDGINPSMLLFRNEDSTNYYTGAVDQVAVISATGAFQMDLYNQMAPVADQDTANGLALKRYLRAYSLMFEQVESYARDSPEGVPGWGKLANPATAPAETLDYWAQVAGVTLIQGAPTKQKRLDIKHAKGRERGTRNAVVKSVQSILTGTKFVAMHERTSDNDHFQVGVLKSETPSSEWFTNLIVNSSFETDMTGWAAGLFIVGAATSVTRLTSGGFVGDACAKVSTTVANRGMEYTLFSAPASSTFRWRIALRADSPVNVDVLIGPYSGGVVVSSTVAVTTAWQEFSGTLTPTSSPGIGYAMAVRLPTINVPVYVDAVVAGIDSVPPPNYSAGAASPVLVTNAVEAERPVGFFQDSPAYLDDPWTLWTIGSTVVARVNGVDADGEPIVAYDPIYPYYQDIYEHFTTYDDLLNHHPHSWPNLLARYYDPNIEKNVGFWGTGLVGSLVPSSTGTTITTDTGTVFKDTTAGRLTTSGAITNAGMILDLQGLLDDQKTYSINIFLRAITTAAAIEVWAGPNATPTLIYSGTIPTGSWTQVQGQFIAGLSDNHFVVRVPAATARTINFDMYALTPGVFTFPPNATDY